MLGCGGGQGAARRRRPQSGDAAAPQLSEYDTFDRKFISKNLGLCCSKSSGTCCIGLLKQKPNFNLSTLFTGLQLGVCKLFKIRFSNKLKKAWKHRFLDALVALHAMMSRWSVEDARENSWRANARCS